MIYLDYAASTPIDPAIKEGYLKVLDDGWANPSAPHALGRRAKAYLEKARQSVSELLHVKPQEIIFTSTASESNNTVFKTFLEREAHIITSEIEHSSISELARNSVFSPIITTISTNFEGRVELDKLTDAIKSNTQLISLHLSHNEHGVVQPIIELSKKIRTINEGRKQQDLQPIFLHVDASQSPQYLVVSPNELGVDYLTLSSHKIYAPRGAALLFRSARAPLTPLILGGGQEFGLRAGTENVAAIHAFAKALEMCELSRAEVTQKAGILRDELAVGLLKEIPIKINGVFEPGNYSSRIANNLHFTLPDIDQESALLLYDQLGVCISAGSACTSGSISTPEAIKQTNPIKGAHIRASLGKLTNEEEINNFAKITKEIYNKLK